MIRSSQFSMLGIAILAIVLVLVILIVQYQKRRLAKQGYFRIPAHDPNADLVDVNDQ